MNRSAEVLQQNLLDTARMNADVMEEIVMESVGCKLWVTSRRRRRHDHKAMLKTISVFPLYPDCQNSGNLDAIA